MLMKSISENNDAPSRRTSVMSNVSHASFGSAERYEVLGMSQNVPAALTNILEENAPGESFQIENKSFFQSMIPFLPLWLSSICLIFNILIPGFGTVISGILAISIGEQHQPNLKERSVFNLLMANFTMGVCQLATVVFFFVGWFWSLAWGVYMVENSLIIRKEEEQKRKQELQKKALTLLLGMNKPGLGGMFKK